MKPCGAPCNLGQQYPVLPKRLNADLAAKPDDEGESEGKAKERAKGMCLRRLNTCFGRLSDICKREP